MVTTSQTEQWKQLLTRLPGVLGAEFTLAGDCVREVHVLSDQSRGPKQIVRDIQSAMLTGFQVELDHRVVSVAQIPCTLRPEGRRILCDRLELSTDRDSSSATVYLTAGDEQHMGQATCDPSAAGRLRAIVLATVDALNQRLGDSCKLSLDDVRQIPMAEHPALLVGLTLKLGGKSESLLGACYEGSDANFSAALAALDAVNRRIAVLPLLPSGQ